MRKGWMVLLAMALMVALAVPASAEMSVSGFYRVKPTLSNFVGNGNYNLNNPGGEDPYSGSASYPYASLVKVDYGAGDEGVETDRSRAFTEMRNRIRFEFGSENVKGVTQFEIDGNFGDTGGRVGRNQGFAANGDSVNIETKNVYVWFKLPNLPMEFTVGLQGYSDEFGGLLFGASDQAGIVAKYNAEQAKVRLTWLKLRDDITFTTTSSSSANTWASSNPGGKEADYYAIDVKVLPTKSTDLLLHVGAIYDRAPADFTYQSVNNTWTKQVYEAWWNLYPDATRLTSYYFGLNGTVKFNPVTLHAGLLYNWGAFTAPGYDDIKVGGWAARLRADGNIGPGKAFIEGLYVSGDDKPEDNKYKSIITGSDYTNLNSFYVSPDMLILFPNADMINSATALVMNPSNQGRGLWLIAAGYSQKFTDKIGAKIGLGYLAADKKRFYEDEGGYEAKGTGMATEINGNVNYNITKGLDFGVYGAYAFLGDFYSRTARGEDDPLNLYTLFGRLNYAF